VKVLSLLLLFFFLNLKNVYAWIESGVTKREGTKKREKWEGKKPKKEAVGASIRVHTKAHQPNKQQETSRN
jgi:hypothetical protein